MTRGPRDRAERLRAGAPPDGSGSDEPTRVDTSVRPTPTPQITGRTIAGRYQILGVVGRGGLGRVFRVRHAALGKEFALKVMTTNLSQDPERRALFYQEAKLASTLLHPNIVSVVDFGEDDVAGAFMVMEYVEGESLARRLRRHRRGVPRKVFFDVILQLAEALHYIHGEGVIHGDIKSENAVCWRVSSASRRRWQIVLLDFGLAFMESSDALPDTLGGTPEYIAPERLEGSAPQPSTDVYSLGVLAYELLTGDVPFRGEPAEVLKKQLTAEPAPIEERRGEEIDERIAALVYRAMAKDPERRHETMDAFLYELRTVMEMLEVRDGRRVMSASDQDPARERRRAAAAAAFVRAPFAMAGINADGAVVVANQAFAKLLTGDRRTQLREDALLGSSFLQIYPSLLRDLRHVHVEGIKTRKELTIQGRDGSQRPITVIMAPGDPRTLGEVHVTIVAGHIETDVA